MKPARYRINGRTFEFVAVNRNYWLLRDLADDTLWKAHGSEIRPRMSLSRYEEPERG